jgi:hypothetical protein
LIINLFVNKRATGPLLSYRNNLDDILGENRQILLFVTVSFPDQALSRDPT